MTTTILNIISVFSALAIIVLALMQTSKSDMGAAFGGGGSSSMFGSRGSANFLSRLTAIMCTVFFISSLTLAYVYTKRSDVDASLLEQSIITESVDTTVEPSLETEQEAGLPAIPEADVIPEVPANEAAQDELPSVPQ